MELNEEKLKAVFENVEFINHIGEEYRTRNQLYTKVFKAFYIAKTREAFTVLPRSSIDYYHKRIVNGAKRRHANTIIRGQRTDYLSRRKAIMLIVLAEYDIFCKAQEPINQSIEEIRAQQRTMKDIIKGLNKRHQELEDQAIRNPQKNSQNII